MHSSMKCRRSFMHSGYSSGLCTRFPRQWPLYRDNDQSSQISSIVVKFYLCHESLLSFSSMTIIAWRVRKDSQPSVKQLSEGRTKFVYANVEIECWFAQLTFLEYCTVIASTEPHVSTCKCRKPLRQDTKHKVPGASLKLLFADFQEVLFSSTG